jgi:hypothetical protein
MMALPRSATRALGRWPWKHNDITDTREGKPKDAFRTSFDGPMSPLREPKVAESQPIEVSSCSSTQVMFADVRGSI